MNAMKILLVCMLLMPCLAFAKESCKLEDIKLSMESPIAERLFYEGTCHYRNQEYSKAVFLWKELSELRDLDAQYAELQIDVLNNLGYMLFFGYGIDENKEEALKYWDMAISMGQTESEYHLCHAYADREVSTYNPVKAKPHCEKAKLIYQGMDKRKPDEEIVLKQIKKYLQQLR